MNGESVATGEAQPRINCTVDADGRIAFVLPPPTAVRHHASQLLLRLRPKKGQPEKTLRILDLESLDDGRRRGVLDPRPALAEGRWDLYLLPEPGAGRQRLRSGLRDLRALVDGQTRDWPSPVAVRVPYTTKDGYLAIRAWLRTAHAEVEGIDATDRSMTVRARLYGASLAESAAVQLRARGGNGTVRTLPARAESDGRRFSFTVDHEELVASSGSTGRVWDIGVQAQLPAGAPLIRISRLLDDVADRKDVFVYPTATVGGAAVRPYYTVDNDLSVKVTPVA